MKARWQDSFPARLGAARTRPRRAVRVLYRLLLEASAAAENGEHKRLEAWRAWFARGCVGEAPEHGVAEAAEALFAAGARPDALAALAAGWRDRAARAVPAGAAELEALARASSGAAGRLVLDLCGHADPRDAALAETLWTAYAMTMSLRDAKASLARGRVVLPLAELAAEGYSEADMRMGVVNDRFRAAMKGYWKRVRTLYDDSRPLARRLPYLEGVEVRYGWALGAALLGRISRAGFDVLHHRPELGRRDLPRLALGALVPR